MSNTSDCRLAAGKEPVRLSPLGASLSRYRASAKTPSTAVAAQINHGKRLKVDQPEGRWRGLQYMNQTGSYDGEMRDRNRVAVEAQQSIQPVGDPAANLVERFPAMRGGFSICQPNREPLRLLISDFGKTSPRPSPVITVAQGRLRRCVQAKRRRGLAGSWGGRSERPIMAAKATGDRRGRRPRAILQ